MSKAANYSAIESLPGGRRLEIRALKPEDRANLMIAVDRVSAQSLYRRFFGAKRHFSEKEVDFFVNIDFANHVALVAEIEEKGRTVIVAGARYVIQRPEVAEVAFVVIDEYQGQGIGAALLRHLAKIAREAGVKEFTAEVLPDNTPMRKVFEKSGLKLALKRRPDATRVTLELC
jgi:RimJ/RimL family protein N-acetyltransferase